MESIIKEIREELRLSADEKTFQTSQNFFKEKILFYGVRVPVVNKIGKAYYSKIAGKSKKEIFELCEELWKSGFIEESFIACNWSYSIKKQYGPPDYEVFERWINKYVNNWASCDTLCNHTVGDFIMMYPEYIEKLKGLSTSSNRWARRASAVSLIIPARKGLFIKEIFEIADILLMDKDDLVQKAYGWMLKSASEAHQKEVFDYVLKHKKVMPRTALRYAIEKMPSDIKKVAMEK